MTASTPNNPSSSVRSSGGGQVFEIRAAAQHNGRVRGKRQNNGGIAGGVRPENKRVQNLLVAAVNAIEYADGQPGVLDGETVERMIVIHNDMMDEIIRTRNDADERGLFHSSACIGACTPEGHLSAFVLSS